MTKEEELIELLKGNILPKENGFKTVIQATVEEVGDTTCSVKLIDNDLILEDVLFSATEENELGLVLVPKKGTNALIGLIGDDENSLCLLKMDEIEEVKLTVGETKLNVSDELIKLNDGNNGGLVVSEEVADDLNSIKSDLNDLKNAIIGFIPVPQDGGAALKASLTAWSTSLFIDTVKENLENDKVTH